MMNKYIEKVKTELSILNHLVKGFELHLNSEITLQDDIRQTMLTNDIYGIYNQRAWYLLLVEYLRYTSLEGVDFFKIRDMILDQFDPECEKIFTKFRELEEKAIKYSLNEEASKRIDDYIRNHPIFLKRLKLEPLYDLF